MKINKIMAYFVVVILMAMVVIGYATNEMSKPIAYSTSTTLAVNVSGGVNASGITDLFENNTVNLTILNKSSSTGTYGIYNSDEYTIKASGSTPDSHQFWNQTITLTEERHWLKLNFTNATTGGSLSSESIIDIDLDYYMLQVGNFYKLNISLDTGHINTSGIVKAKSIRLENTSTTAGTCGGSEAGEIRFNGTGGTISFIGCDGSNWASIS